MCPVALTTRMEEIDYVAKSIRNALGPNPTCDPHPPKPYKDGAVLFKHKYADVFRSEYPDLKDVPYSTLKIEHADNPIIQTVCKELAEHNKQYDAKVLEWSLKWPEHAAKVKASRENATTKRKGRKARQMSELDPTSSKRRKEGSVGEAVGMLLPEAVGPHIEFTKMCLEKASELTTAANMILSYVHGEHAKRVRELEYERQYMM